MKYVYIFLFLAIVFSQTVLAQTITTIKYQFPFKCLPISVKKQNVKMAYMDVTLERFEKAVSDFLAE